MYWRTRLTNISANKYFGSAWFSNGFRGLRGLEKLRETCRKNFHQSWYLYSSMVPSYGPKNLAKHMSDVIPRNIVYSTPSTRTTDEHLYKSIHSPSKTITVYEKHVGFQHGTMKRLLELH